MKLRTPSTRKSRRVALLTVGFLLITLSILGTLLYLRPYAEAEMDMTLLDIPKICAPSVLYTYRPDNRQSRRGELQISPKSTLTQARPRVYVTYEDMPPELIHAFVAIEDKRFWSHHGVDFLRTTHAGIRYLLGKSDFGGSTITQQLVKNLTGNNRHTPERKLTEIFQALDLERQADKTRILEAYLNVINLAEGCCGVGAAANRYFSKSVSELTLAECASIAAITNNPTLYNPLTHPENNQSRRNLILREMAAQEYITQEQCAQALLEELKLTPSTPSSDSPVTSWYTDLVVSDVIRDLCERLDYTYEAASMLVYQGGLTIETAMDPTMQEILETYYADLSHFPTGEQGMPQSSCILIDPTTGDILAVAGAVGGKNANRLQNYATDTRRPAGSCIKPLTVYAPALEKGIITWATLFEDHPLTERNGTPWPANADGQYRGYVTIGQAVAHSLNPVAVQIVEKLGLQEALSFARDRLGMESLIPSDDRSLNDVTLSSLALGQQSRGVTVRELTAAYTSFTDGVYRAPVSYHRALDHSGRVLLENPPVSEASRALSQANAALMTRLLATVTQQGTAARSVTLEKAMGIQAAGKTGTTQNNCDRWFIGYTPRLLAGVWMGYDYPSELKGISGNPCVGLWDDLMKLWENAYTGAPPKSRFDENPALIELDFCPLSGKLPTPYCADPVTGHEAEHGWFVRGTEPAAFCDHHTEPPIRLIPHDPSDPNRIPLLPNDVLPSSPAELPPTKPSPTPLLPRLRQFFGFFGKGRDARA